MTQASGARTAGGLTWTDVVPLGCFFLSGFTALTYEICWIRKAALVFGATTPAVSTVLAVFFGGLAIGSYLAGRYSRRAARALAAYALVEIALGILVLCNPTAFELGERLFGAVYPDLIGHRAMLALARLGIVTLIVLPPTILVGATLPLFCRHYVIHESRISASTGFLYGLNTLGAAVGCAVCGFVLIPHIGINTSLRAGGIVNILIGALVWYLYRGRLVRDGEQVRRSHRPRRKSDEALVTESLPADDLSRRRRIRVMYVLFFLSGLVALANEVLWTRYLSLLVRNTVHTYTLALTVTLIGIVLGSMLTSGFFDRSSRRAFHFGWIQALTGLVVLTVLLLPAAWWQATLRDSRYQSPLWVFLVIFLLPAILSGAAFPLAVRMVVQDPRAAAAGVGSMAAVNTLGGITGALAAGFVALPFLGLHRLLLATTGLSVAVGVTAWLSLERSMTLSKRLSLAGASVALWLAIPPLMGTRLPADFLAGRDRLIEFREGLSSHLAVVRKDDHRVLEIDRLWQGESRKRHQGVAAHVPSLLHPDPRSVLVIGLGIGQTAGRFLMHDIERLDCVDIERELVPLVRRHFESAWMDDERVRFIVEDGRNYLHYTQAAYDLISLEVGQVFRPGVAAFYTSEFYRSARQRLNAEGLLCQFVPVSFFTVEEFQTVIRTFIEVFPRSVLWYNTGELLLIGANGEHLTLMEDRLDRLLSDPALREDLAFAYWGGPDHWLHEPEVFLAGFLAGPDGLARFCNGADVYHDDRPYLEYATSRVRETVEAEIVDALRSCLEPVTDIVDRAIGPELARASEALREQNLRDIVADALKREAGELRATGQSREAIDRLREALQWNTENVEANVLLADELIRKGDIAAAATHLESAVRINPHHAAARYGLGFVLHRMERLEDAIHHYTASLRLEPDQAEAHNNLGTALAQTGDYEGAHSHFERAVQLDPDYRDARDNLARVMKVLQQPGVQPRAR